MTTNDKNRDASLDAGLRAIGPSLPEPATPASVRSNIDAMLESGDDRQGVVIRRLRMTSAALTGLAAILAFAVVWLGMDNARLRAAPGVPVVAVQRAGYAVVNFHHDQCPMACAMTPHVRDLESETDDRGVVFVTFDLTKKDEFQRAYALAQVLGIEHVLDQSQGNAKTGNVALVDIRAKQVLVRIDAPERLPELSRTLHSCQQR